MSCKGRTIAEFMKKIKSLVSILLAVFVVFASCVTANAASASISAYASKVNVTSGDTITVTVSLNSCSGISGINFTLTYNSSHLQYVSSSIGGAGDVFSLKNANQSGSSIKGAFMNVDGSTSSSTGTLATVTFKVISSASAKSPLSLSASATDSAANTVSVTATGTTLTLGTTTAKPSTTKPTTTKPTTTKPTTTKPTTTKPTTTEPTTEGESTTKVIATETIAVTVGNSYQLAKPSSMSGKVTYSSSKTSVASVTDAGVISTIAKGMTTITAVSENGVTKTWLLIVGDGSTVEKEDESTTLTDEETTTELQMIGSVTEENTTEEETTADTKDSLKKDKGDETFRLIFGTGAVVAVLIIIIIIVSMIRKRRSFVG